jgi:hypothetical protein
VQLALITPIDLLDFAGLSNYHLLLPQLFTNDKYRRFYSDARGHKILDNGVAEGHVMDYRRLQDIALAWQVDEVVVPDVMGDCQGTIDLARDFEKYAQPTSYHYVGVAQGRTLAEVIKCITFFQYCDYVSVLALPRILNTIHKTQRFHLIEPIAKEFKFDAIHCLGASSWVREVIALDSLGIVRGMDTSLPVVLGLGGRGLADDLYMDRPADYFDRQVERGSLTWKVIDDNVRRYFDWAGASYGSGEEAPVSEL